MTSAIRGPPCESKVCDVGPEGTSQPEVRLDSMKANIPRSTAICSMHSGVAARRPGEGNAGVVAGTKQTVVAQDEFKKRRIKKENFLFACHVDASS